MVFVIGLAIVSFLLMDSLSSNSNILGGTSNTVGEIDGQEISIQEYQRKVQEAIDNYKLSSNQSAIDDQTMWLLRDQTWEQYVNEMLMKKEYDKLGIKITSDELFDLIQGPNPHPAVVQSFSDPNTGRFDPAQIMTFLQRLDEDATGETRTRWLNFEKFLKEDRLRTKYSTLVRKGTYVPNWMAKDIHQTSGTTFDFEYIYLPYSDVSDNEVAVSESELKNYISLNKGKYKQDESRTIEYISFDIIPTSEDTFKARTKLLELEDNFHTTKNDSIFIKLYSDKPFNHRYLGREELVSSVADTFFTIDTNTIIGPYLEGGSFVLAKLIDRKLIPDSVKARHIFLDIITAQSQADVEFKRNQADSLVEQLKNGADFNEMALKFSDANDTKFNNGDMGWIMPGEKFRTINDALFYKKRQGDIFTVPSDDPDQRGFHVIEITQAKPSKEAVKVAFLSRQILPSIETERQLYSKASEFAGTHSTADKFKAASEKYNIRQAEGIRKNDNTIFGMGPARDVVKWAYIASANDVSNVFSLDDKYVVAYLTKIKNEGTIPLEDIKPEVELEVKKQKKAEILIGKFNKTNTTGLENIASALKLDINAATGLNFNDNFIPSVGLEVEVVNKAIGMEKGQTSKPLAGSNGVFVIKVTGKDTPAALPGYSAEKQRIRLNATSNVDAAIVETVKKSATVKDERYKFY